MCNMLNAFISNSNMESIKPKLTDMVTFNISKVIIFD